MLRFIREETEGYVIATGVEGMGASTGLAGEGEEDAGNVGSCTFASFVIAGKGILTDVPLPEGAGTAVDLAGAVSLAREGTSAVSGLSSFVCPAILGKTEGIMG